MPPIATSSESDPQGSSAPNGPLRAPPRFLDAVERVLLRVILGALLLLGALLGFAAWHARHGGAALNAPVPAISSITLVVDFGDGSQRRLSGLPFTPDMTVLDAMNLAKSHPHPIRSTINGTGERALLTTIDDLASEGIEAGITTARCWQYWVNAQYGMTSIGVAKLQPGDRVTWAYRPYENDPKPPPQ